MTNEEILTKSAILGGTENLEYLYVKEWDGKIALRPLSEGQYAQVEAIRAAGSTMKGNPVIGPDGNVDKEKTSANLEFNLDLQKSAEMDFEADALAAAYAMSVNGETWTDADVKNIRPPGIVKRIARKVYQMSGVTPQQIEQVQNFRGESGRKANNKSASKRSADSK